MSTRCRARDVLIHPSGRVLVVDGAGGPNSRSPERIPPDAVLQGRYGARAGSFSAAAGSEKAVEIAVARRP